jgi:hypothetical protein
VTIRGGRCKIREQDSRDKRDTVNRNCTCVVALGFKNRRTADVSHLPFVAESQILGRRYVIRHARHCSKTTRKDSEEKRSAGEIEGHGRASGATVSSCRFERCSLRDSRSFHFAFFHSLRLLSIQLYIKYFIMNELLLTHCVLYTVGTLLIARMDD